jgi:hypothetical protein
MKEMTLQIQPKCPHCKSVVRQYAQEDEDVLKEYKEHQPIRTKTHGVKKSRSLAQLRLYWALCGIVADNSETPGWKTKEQVDFQCRVALDFRDPNVVVVKPDGTVVFHYRSIAFKNLGHIEACNYFDRAFEVMAKFLKVPVRVFVGEGENNL